MRISIDELRAIGIKYRDQLLSNANTISFITPLDDYLHGENCKSSPNNNTIIIEKFRNFNENIKPEADIYYKAVNCC